MKKSILTLALAFIAMAVSAQRFLDANQRLLGYYTSDDVDNSVGLVNAPGKMQAGAYLLSSDYAQYVGAKVVGIRFALGTDAKSTGVAVYGVTPQYTYKQLTSVDVDNEGPGWHTVMFGADKQFTLTNDWKAIVPAYKYTQTRKNYPIGVNTTASKRDLYIYGSIPTAAGGSGREEWNNMGDGYGAVAIQLILETDVVTDNAVTPTDFGSYRVPLGQTKTVNVTFTNFGTTLKSFDYTITLDDKTSAEYHVDLSAEPLGPSGTVTVPVNMPAAAAMGTYPVELNVTKVNGEENQAQRTSAAGTCITIFKEFTQRVLVEEMTGTGCGWCPRGIAGMRLLKQTFGDRFVGIAIHRYNASTDPMSPREYLSLSTLPAVNAPLCIVNRSGEQSFDPYYGTANQPFGSYNDIAAKLSDMAETGVSVAGVWNEDQTEVTATAVVESNVAGSYDIAFVLVADSIVGDGAAWYQNNNYAQYSSTEGEYADDPNIAQFCRGGFYGSNPITNLAYDDVAIAASYDSHSTKATLDPVTAGGSVTSSYTLKLPTKNSLKPYIRKDKVSVVAILTDKTTGHVINVAQNEHISPLTSVAGVTATDGEAVEVARYNAAGQRIGAPQKGLNIIKYSNGRTVKVIVK